MNQNSEILSKLIEEDFGLITRENSRWGKGEKHDSLVLDKENGVAYWNSRNLVLDPVNYLMKVRGMSFQDATRYLRTNKNYLDTYVYTVGGKRGDVVAYPKLVGVFWENGINYRDYWKDRNLTDDTINRFQLGYTDGWYVVPIFVDGTFVNFQKRRDIPSKQILPWYRGIGSIQFNYDIMKIVDKVVITEGLVDSILLSQEGFPAISHTSGSHGFKPEWFSRFIRQKTVYYVADNDKAGKEGAVVVSNILGQYRVKIVSFEGFPENYDAVDFFRDGYTKEDFKEMLDNSKHLFELGWKGDL